MHERELKFTPGPSFRLPPLDDPELGVRADPDGSARLVAIYFDTADLRLARAGASLRYREPEGWTVKLPVARSELLTRDELHVHGEPGDPPEGAIDLVAAIIRRAPLVIVARLITLRDTVVLHDLASGQSLGEVVDDEVSVLDGARLVARFRELEVELEPHAPEGMVEAIATRLRAAGAGLPHLVPKVVRALGPRALEPPDVVTPPKPGTDSTAADLAHAAIVESVVRLLAHDPGVRLGDEPEDVHQMRVATRRLRSDLRTFRPVFDRAWSDPLRDELEWLGGLLGHVRDTEVLLDRLDTRVESLAEVDRDAGKRLLDTLRDHRDDARVTLLAALRSERYLTLLDQLVAATHGPTLAGDVVDDVHDIDIARLVRKPWRELRDAVDELDDDPADPALHAVRKLAKRARYASEAIQPALGAPAKDFARRAAALQDVLGEHQDAVVAEQWLREHARGSTQHGTEHAFVAGQLVSLERQAGDDARDQWAARVEAPPARAALALVMSSDSVIRAAGGVVLRATADGAREVLLVHRPKYDDWSLPKGKADSGERPEQTALREVEEETGLRCRLGTEVGKTRYRDSQGRSKVVRYWLMEPEADDPFVPNHEVDAVRWCSFDDARAALSYAHDRKLLARALETV